MDTYRINVFISSTSKDLLSHREAVMRAIVRRGMHPIDMRDFEASSSDAVSLCRSKVQDAHVMVCIYALRYGYIPADLPHEIMHLKGKSITEMEYIWAEEQGIDRLVFVVDADKIPKSSSIFEHADIITAEAMSAKEIESSAKKKALLDTFLERIGQVIVWSTFSNEDNLAMQVSESLLKWQEKWEPTVEDIPKRPKQRTSAWKILTMLAGLCLAFVISLAGFRLYQAGGFSLTGTGQPLTFLLLFAATLPLMLFALKSYIPLKPNRFWAMLASLMFILTIVVWQMPRIVNQTYIDLIEQNLANNDIGSSEILLDMIGDNSQIDDLLQSALLSMREPVGQLVKLLLEYQSEGQISQLSDTLKQQIEDAISVAQDVSRARYFSQALAMIDPENAAIVAGNLNDMGVSILASDPSRGQEGRHMFEVAILLDDLTQLRTVKERSVAVYNYALMLEKDITIDNNIQTAIDSYKNAIEIDPSNYAAYYAASSLLLITSDSADNAAQTLSEAVTIANQGWENSVQQRNPDACDYLKTLNRNDDENFLERWYCFILMATESGSLIARNNENLGDMTRSRELAINAVALAEASDNFQNRQGYFPAEAYYYAALTQSDPEHDTLCNIIKFHNRNSPRQRGWVDYANRLLGNETCN